MSDEKSLLASLARALSILLLLAFVLVEVGFGQDPSGRPTKGKKPPTRKGPGTKSEPQPLTVTLTIMTDPPASEVS